MRKYTLLYKVPIIHSYLNDTRILYMGGLDKENKTTKSIYELNEDSTEWKRIDPDLPIKVGGKENQMFALGNELCP